MIKNFNDFIKEEFFFGGLDITFTAKNGNSVICEIKDGQFIVQAGGLMPYTEAEENVIDFIQQIEKSWDDFKSNDRFIKTNPELPNKAIIDTIYLSGLSLRIDSKVLNRLTTEIKKIMPVTTDFTQDGYMIFLDKPLEFNFEMMKSFLPGRDD